MKASENENQAKEWHKAIIARNMQSWQMASAASMAQRKYQHGYEKQENMKEKMTA